MLWIYIYLIVRYKISYILFYLVDKISLLPDLDQIPFQSIVQTIVSSSDISFSSGILLNVSFNIWLSSHAVGVFSCSLCDCLITLFCISTNHWTDAKSPSGSSILSALMNLLLGYSSSIVSYSQQCDRLSATWFHVPSTWMVL